MEVVGMSDGEKMKNEGAREKMKNEEGKKSENVIKKRGKMSYNRIFWVKTLTIVHASITPAIEMHNIYPWKCLFTAIYIFCIAILFYWSHCEALCNPAQRSGL